MLNFVAACITILAGLVPGSQDNVELARTYASEAPYGNEASTRFKKPPDGYELFFVETIGRHGSRTATNDDEKQRILKLWEQAKEQDALTEVGEDLKDDLEQFYRDQERIGYGELTSIGRAEMAGIGRRTAENYADFFTRAQEDGDEIAFVTSPVNRTKESAAAMKGEIKERFPELKVAKDAVSERTLVIDGNPSATGRRQIKEYKRIQDVENASYNILANIYQPQFIPQIKNKTDAALDLYKVYQRGPSMAADSSVDLTKYVDAADAELMGREQNAEKFYRYGPGHEGEENSYIGAKPLLNDFMKRLEERVDGGKTAAVFRHAHGETLMPFTALTQLRSANDQELAVYSVDNNPWRGYLSGPLAGSVEWAAYRNGQGKILLTLRFNEEPSRFSKACQPTEPDGPFYTLEEIRSCINSRGGFV